MDTALDDLVDPRQPFALLDFPDHDNIGDSAIYQGEITYFARRKLRPAYVATTNNCAWDVLERRIGDGPIFLHGGGNFGDIWPWFQPFREAVLTRYPGRKIVQLPQTIHYASQERLDQTARVIERHDAFTLLVRDQPSYELASRAFQCDVRLCPDAAFQIGPMAAGTPRHKLLLLLRIDQEAARDDHSAAAQGIAGMIEADWPREENGYIERVDRANRLKMALAYALRGGRPALREARYRGRAEARVRRGIDLLRTAEYVITDRLHAHILCLLLGIPHCVLENSYGKLSRFMQAWGTGEGVQSAASVAEAIESFGRRKQH